MTSCGRILTAILDFSSFILQNYGNLIACIYTNTSFACTDMQFLPWRIFGHAVSAIKDIRTCSFCHTGYPDMQFLSCWISGHAISDIKEIQEPCSLLRAGKTILVAEQYKLG